MMPTSQHRLSNVLFNGLSSTIKLYDKLGLRVISTARPFSFYRKVFFNNRSEVAILADLRGKTVVDIGCGLTPFTEDSMFQACRRHGIAFYGVDPKLKQGFKFGMVDSLWSTFTGARNAPRENMPGQDKAIGTYADQLPFDDASVDIVLSSWLLFVWLQDPKVLAAIFTEFDRVLKPGGRISFYPSMRWQDMTTKYPFLLDVLKGYRSEQQFWTYVRTSSLPFAYTIHLTKEK
ncbi:MAG TPA: class I SAM-dependent methyltransferase [Dongiaceae bacterium]|nr:class I SAM-dependent methyltransferase [Dongiaceae bacterium]